MNDEAAPPSDNPGSDNPRSRRSPMRIAAIIAIAVVAVIALGYGAIFFYANVLNDAPDELDESDLDAALNATTTVGGATPVATSAVTDPVATDPAASDPAGTAPVGTTTPVDSVADGDVATGFDGTWTATTESEFGYRVEEVLAGVNTTAVGRSNEIDGTLTVEGTTVPAVDVSVEVATITSDKSQRDGAFAGRVMNSSEFPTATFTLTEPIELGAIPAEGEQVTATATGDLTLRGVTNSVTFEVTAQANADRIGVLGSIPIVFSDYGIDNPSFGTVTTEDDGLLEFVLVFERT